jgi:carbon monoxide dehydrogenase subunit G
VHVEESFEMAVDSAALWPWISEPERLAEWITDARRFESQPPGELEEGSRLIVHPRSGAPIEAKVEQVERGRSLVLRASGLPNDLEVLLTLRVRDQEGRSVLTLRAESELRGLLIFAEKMIASKARAKLRSWAEALKKRIGS